MAGIDYSPPREASMLAWVGDSLQERERVLVTGGLLEASDFGLEGAVRVQASANAAADATTVSVGALAGAIPSGTVLDFGGKKFARLTANAAKGATSLTVAALPAAISSGDAATYNVPGSKKYVESGTLVGRTFEEEEDGRGFGPYASGDDQAYLILHDVQDAARDASATFYRNGSLVYWRHLPPHSKTPAALANIREFYPTQMGEE